MFCDKRQERPEAVSLRSTVEEQNGSRERSEDGQRRMRIIDRMFELVEVFEKIRFSFVAFSLLSMFVADVLSEVGLKEVFVRIVNRWELRVRS